MTLTRVAGGLLITILFDLWFKQGELITIPLLHAIQHVLHSF